MRKVKTKTCTKCGEEKALSEFGKNCKYKDELAYWCKSCTKSWRLENKERIKKLSKLYYLNHSDEIKKRCKKYQNDNKESTKERTKAYAVKYRITHREQLNIENKKSSTNKRITLHSTYIKYLIKRSYHLPIGKISDLLIECYREYTRNNRLIKEM